MALVAASFIAFSIWVGDRILPEHPAPQSPPSLIKAMPPARAIHKPKDGYVLGITLSVKDCDAPVTGSAIVVLPREFFRVEREWGLGRPARALFGLAFSDPTVTVTGTAADDDFGSVPSWSWTFDDRYHANATGRVAIARFDGWNEDHSALHVGFVAHWLHPRGYRSCWLSLPELVSSNLSIFGTNASNSVEERLGRRSRATPLMEGEFSSGYEIRYSSGQVVSGSDKQINQYADASTPPALGTVALDTKLSIIAGDSQGAPPSVGTPIWSCQDEADTTGSGFLGQDVDGAFRWNATSGLEDYLPSTGTHGCGAWVALEEAGARTDRDVWLLLLGASLSAGVALLIELVIGRTRSRPRQA